MAAAKRSGFTLIELLVVITIIGILAALVLPAVQGALESARRTACAKKLQELGRSVDHYETKKGHYPGSFVPVTGAPHLYPWVPQVFPYYDQQQLHDQMLQSPTLAQGSPNRVFIDGLKCPSDQKQNFGPVLSYAANMGRQDDFSFNQFAPHLDWLENGLFHDRRRSIGNQPYRPVTVSRRHLKDGATTTIMLAENVDATEWAGVPDPNNNGIPRMVEYDTGVLWTPNPVVGLNRDRQPAVVNNPYDYARPSSEHTNGFNVTMCDGSVRYLDEQISYQVYARLMTLDGKTIAQRDNSLAWQAVPIDDRELNP